jgi:hypothetical protein
VQGVHRSATALAHLGDRRMRFDPLLGRATRLGAAFIASRCTSPLQHVRRVDSADPVIGAMLAVAYRPERRVQAGRSRTTHVK